ncbi:hypothetical protein Q5752_004860 [Cryptotrichosporon argae]
MKEIRAADTAFATAGAVLWSIQVVPQIVKTYRTKSVEGLSSALMFIWTFAALVQGCYLIAARSSIPLQVQPQCFTFFSFVSSCQTLYYGPRRWSRPAVLALGAGGLAVLGAFEVGSVFALRAGERNGTTAPQQFYGWLASALLVLGLLPQYYEIYKLRRVVGISVAFMATDMLGGVFSFLSLFFRATFDYTAFCQYALIVVGDGIIVVLALMLNRRPTPDAEKGVGGGAGAGAGGSGDNVGDSAVECRARV